MSEFDLLRTLGIEAPSPQEEEEEEDSARARSAMRLLSTEQRHPRTASLGQTARVDAEAALRDLLAVDRDISDKMEADAGASVLLDAVEGMRSAVAAGRRIYLYGCGASGRVAMQAESSFWRPFWRGLGKEKGLGGGGGGSADAAMVDLCVGEMAGGDGGLVDSLDELEDLTEVGMMQLEERGVGRGDLVLCMTGSGASSSVVGAVLAARQLYDSAEEARKKIFFMFNNESGPLRSLEGPRRVLDEPGISKICFRTGPQAVAGSTRMQAATCQTFLVGILLEQAVYEHLRQSEGMSAESLGRLGFREASLEERMLRFADVQGACEEAVSDLARLSEMESDVHGSGGGGGGGGNAAVACWADSAALTVFSDCTERSLTFGILPFDMVGAARKESPVRVVTPPSTKEEAWRSILGREFRGLDAEVYGRAFRSLGVDSPVGREAALRCLGKAGSDRAALYDFSSGAADGMGAGDAGVAFLMDCDELSTGSHKDFLERCRKAGSKLGLVLVTAEADKAEERNPDVDVDVLVHLRSPAFVADPLLVRRNVGLKMLLNAHSTCVMARLGRLTGNTMTSVRPAANLKLVDRAADLVRMHANDGLSRLGGREVGHAQARAVLLHVLVGAPADGHVVGEVGLSVVLVLEASRRRGAVSVEEAARILTEREGLEGYLRDLL